MNSQYVLPNVFVDIVIFGYFDHKLQVLLNKRLKAPEYGKFALPGGQIHANEDQNLEDTANRMFKEKVGAELRYLEQLKTYGSATRDSRGWSLSVSYLGLIDQTQTPQIQNSIFVPVEHLKKEELPFDHFEIIHDALERIKNKAAYSSLPAFFLPQEFTLTELQGVYEKVLGVKLNASAFRRKIAGQNIIKRVEVEKQEAQKKGRPSEKYQMRNADIHDMGRVLMLPDQRRGGDFKI